MMKKLLEITEIATLLPNHERYRSQISIALIKDLNEDCVSISRTYLLCFPINNSSKSVTIGPGRFIDSNDSASPIYNGYTNLL